MRCLILNGNPDPGRTGWESYLSNFAKNLETAGTQTRLVTLRELDIRFCTGCWSCWWKTPGLCAHRDDMRGMYPEILAADVTVWASPLVLGTVSALTKRTQDRFIPLIHPYFDIAEGEFHHRRRYTKAIDFGLLVERGPVDTAEDEEIVRRLFERFSRNARGQLKFFATTAEPSAAAAGRLAGGLSGSQEVIHEAIGA